MKKNKIITKGLTLFIFSAILLFPKNSFPATLHAILVADTIDKGIGCIYDHKNMIQLIKKISKYTGMKLKYKEFKDKNWSRKAIMKAVKRLRPKKNDMVLFYYSGHGFRMGSKKNKWPTMALKNDQGLDEFWAYKTILAKKPRFLLVIADSCNSIAPEGIDVVRSRFFRKDLIIKNYKKLFLKYKGAIIASGCLPGQFSFGGPPDGGAYTNAWRNALENAAKSSNPSWDRIMKLANKPLQNGKQQPQFAINFKYHGKPETITVVDDNKNKVDPENKIDAEGCTQLAETREIFINAIEEIESKGKLKSSGKAYKKLKGFFKMQLGFAADEGLKDTIKMFKKYLKILKKRKWTKLLRITKEFKKDWDGFYVKDKCQSLEKQDEEIDYGCKETEKTIKTLSGILKDLNKKGKLSRKSKSYKKLKGFFKDELKIAEEEKWKDSITSYKEYLQYMRTGDWDEIIIIVSELHDEYKKMYKKDCKK